MYPSYYYSYAIQISAGNLNLKCKMHGKWQIKNASAKFSPKHEIFVPTKKFRDRPIISTDLVQPIRATRTKKKGICRNWTVGPRCRPPVTSNSPHSCLAACQNRWSCRQHSTTKRLHCHRSPAPKKVHKEPWKFF